MAKPWNLRLQHALRWPRIAALVVLSVLAVAFSGCRAVDNAQVDVMERELRQQEDYIYELEDYLIEYSEKLRQCRSCEPGMMMESSTSSTRAADKPEPTLAVDPPRSAAPRRPNGTRVVPPIEVRDAPPDAFDAPLETPAEPMPEPATAPESTPEATPIDPSELEAPGLEIGPTSDLQWKGAAPIATTPPGTEAPPYIPDPADYHVDAEPTFLAEEPAVDAAGETAPAEAAPLTAEDAPELIAAEPAPPVEGAELTLPPATDSQRPTAERLEIRRVYGDPAAAEAGSSLLVVVEALNSTDEPVDANGEISLMVMAGETQESLKRVERWDFTAEETQAAWQSSQLGDGLHLELPLQEASLPEGRLELWARLVSADGTKLLTRLPFAASELTPLDAGAVDATVVAEQESAAQSGGEELAAESSDDARQASAEAEAGTQWRASSEPLSVDRVESYSTTVGAPTGSWTRQPPGGRAPLAGTPRVASRDDGPPRWQQGSGDAPKSERGGEWAPFR